MIQVGDRRVYQGNTYQILWLGKPRLTAQGIQRPSVLKNVGTGEIIERPIIIEE